MTATTRLTAPTDLSAPALDRTPDRRCYWDHRLAAWVRHGDVAAAAPLQRAGDADADVPVPTGFPVR